MPGLDGAVAAVMLFGGRRCDFAVGERIVAALALVVFNGEREGYRGGIAVIDEVGQRLPGFIGWVSHDGGGDGETDIGNFVQLWAPDSRMLGGAITVGLKRYDV